MMKSSLRIVTTLLCCIVLTRAQTDGVLPVVDGPGECVALSSGLCSDLQYTAVYLPNFRDHQTQSEAVSELSDFQQLIESGCSELANAFFCSYYLPLCFTSPQTNQVIRLKPCQSLCEETRQSCEPVLLQNSNFTWPSFLDCSLDTFPNDGSTCFGPQAGTQAPSSTITEVGATSFTAVANGSLTTSSGTPMVSSANTPTATLGALASCLLVAQLQQSLLS